MQDSNPRPPLPYDSYGQSDDIDLRDLFKRIWATRRVVLISVLLITAMFWGAWVIMYLANPKAYTYSRIIQFTFKGVEEGEYPNGSPFRVADVVGPKVLSLVYDQNQLEAYGIPEHDFVQSFTIHPYAPDYNLIINKYQMAIERKNISVEEVNQLQEKMKIELQQASVRSARISFTPHRSIDLPENIINKVLLDVPRVWTTKAIEDDGVANLDIALYSSKMFDQERFANLDYMVAFDLIRDNVARINQNIDELLEKPNGRVVTDKISGYSLPDLKKVIEDIVNYDLNQMFTPLQELGIAKNEEVVAMYYRYKLQRLERQTKFSLRQAELIEKTLKTYENKRLESTDVAGQSGGGSTAIPQLGGDFITRLIDLTEESSDKEFRQQLIEQILENQKKAVDNEEEIAEIQVTLSAMDNSKEESELREYYDDLVQKTLPEMLKKLREYVDTTGRIYEKLSKENLGYGGLLYKVSGDDQLDVTGRLVSRKQLLIFLMLIVVGAFIVMIGSVIANFVKEK